MREATAHAFNGARKLLPRRERIGWERKKKCQGVAHEFQWDWARDKEKYMAPRERWGEIRKPSFPFEHLPHHAVFYIPQESVTSASIPLLQRDRTRTHIDRATHPHPLGSERMTPFELLRNTH